MSPRCIQTIPKLSGLNNKHLYLCSRVFIDRDRADLGETQLGECMLAGFDSGHRSVARSDGTTAPRVMFQGVPEPKDK